MRNLFRYCVLILLANPNLSFGQWNFVITSVEIIPEFPLPTDEVKVAFELNTVSVGIYDSQSFIILNDTVHFSVCLGVSGAGSPSTIIDTVSLGFLPEADYHLNFVVRSSNSPPYCQPANDSGNVQLDFTVSASNSIEDYTNTAINVYPNPFVNQVNIYSQTKIIGLELMDMRGKLIYNYTMDMLDDHSIISFPEGLPSGQYFLRVVNECGVSFVKLVRTG